MRSHAAEQPPLFAGGGSVKKDPPLKRPRFGPERLPSREEQERIRRFSGSGFITRPPKS